MCRITKDNKYNSLIRNVKTLLLFLLFKKMSLEKHSSYYQQKNIIYYR